MKHTKKLLALLLTLALALSLAMPAMAAVNWDDFRITTQPQSMDITYGESFTLSVEVDKPNGVEVEYQWYRLGGTTNTFALEIEGATAFELRLSADDTNLYYPSANWSITYYCVISAYEKDAGGTVLSSQTLTSGRARVASVEKEKTFWEKVYSVTLEPWAFAGTATMLAIMLNFGLNIPLAPFYFLFYLISGYAEGFKALF